MNTTLNEFHALAAQEDYIPKITRVDLLRYRAVVHRDPEEQAAHGREQNAASEPVHSQCAWTA